MDMIKIAILFLALFSMPHDQYNLAKAIDGERPNIICPNMDSVECQDLADRIGQVAVNRLGAGWCSTILKCVEGGFWGAREVGVPRRWAMDAAGRVLRRKEVTDDFYVFSAADREKLNLPKTDANHIAERGSYGLYFYGPRTQW